MIVIKNLSFSYGNKKILENINFSFYNNNIYGLIGRNGIGKTTFLECLNGNNKIIEGELMINNVDYTKKSFLNNPLLIINNQKIFYKNLTVKEHFNLFTILNDLDINKTLEIFNLVDYSDYFPNELSLGTSQRFNIALRLVCRNNDILADEPFNGLDLIEIQNLQSIFHKLKNKQRSIIISSHDILSLVSICDVILHLKNGRLEIIDKKDTDEINKIQTILQ
ncbi:ATP-binding cassette domain-containing protein [Mycoplasma sp. P36-A1]|uniref:ATP-binding cassette domain-containing protein n=1 Tax=Mycoplasma sp. P36-A1 TaxID=3252900 RepID=UPI003C2E0345